MKQQFITDSEKTLALKSYRMVYHRITRRVQIFSMDSNQPIISISMRKIRRHLVDLENLSQKLNMSGSPDDLTSLGLSLRVLQIMVANR